MAFGLGRSGCSHGVRSREVRLRSWRSVSGGPAALMAFGLGRSGCSHGVRSREVRLFSWRSVSGGPAVLMAFGLGRSGCAHGVRSPEVRLASWRSVSGGPAVLMAFGLGRSGCAHGVRSREVRLCSWRPVSAWPARRMGAIQMTEFGGPEVLKLAELPVPEPGPGETLIRVSRAGLNFADTHTRTNSYVRKATLPLVPGGEVAGVREDTGERVVALVGDGGYAEYAVAPKEHVLPIPDGVDDGTALALVVQGTTAWHLYETAGRVQQGESVVVHAAAGGVGSLAV